ncbi:hypothetical protein B0T26DRAFT_726517 [Lasiosphaeria miniovina]|uniref:Uncharacterized protein n=1 Tax=Lasiosphaeria miniovina TaxID=1954250 RepID=A0AA39ZZA9_9PEZI|nr:uncharacterized protein B0T26DRAFT_726517 [Lasiosphaeria miniovina]KAK0706427.1 hypothetical protein B0T26DRAFT_726517 [Lasiosphaeria miniovina]
MFLDRPVWSSDPGSQLRKARRATGAVTEPFSVSPRDTTVASEKQTAKGDDDDEWDVLLSEGCQTASLEDTLVDALEHGIFDVVERGVVGDEAGGLQHVLSELAYDHWLELFEFLGLGIVSLFHRRREQAACCWRMLESLERNADMAGFLERQQRSRELRTSLDRGRVTDVAGLQQGTGCLYTSSDWKELASRVHERIALLVSSPLKPDPSSLAGSTTRTRSSKTSASSRKISRTNTMDASQQQQTDGSAVNNNNDRRSLLPRPSADENQRALDRVSYLGGILIPMPIVSGILSMGDTFGPYGDKFFVFWAAALPLSVLAVLIIYADTIRKAEVWVEIAAERVVPSSSPSSSSGDSEVPVKFDFKEHRKVTWQARKSKRPPSNDEPPVPERMAPETLAELRMDYDIEERIIDMPSARVAEGVDHFMTNVVTGVTSDEDEGDEARPESIAVAPPFLRAATDELRPPPPMILERPSDGSKPRAWKRQSLGWVGAVKSMVGARPRRGDDVPRGIAACEKPGRRKTRTY